MSPFLEGGEGETFVADAPFFKKRKTNFRNLSAIGNPERIYDAIKIKKWKKTWDGVRGVAEIESARLEKRKSCCLEHI